jgi:hypothetical protein
MNESCIYVIGSPGSSTVKIGRTIDLAKRFASIRCMSPIPLEILWSHPGGNELETRLHRHFAKLRIHGEWFEFEGDPVEAVRAAIQQQPWLSSVASSSKMDTDRKAQWLRDLREASDFHAATRRQLDELVAEARAAGVPLTAISEHTPYSREWARKIADQIDAERAKT